MKSEVYKRKVDTPDELLARTLDAAVRIEKREDQTDEQHVIFAHALESVVRLPLGFSNVRCGL
jgi:hypothetical protein